MQAQSQKKSLPEIPEYFLYWSLENPGLLKRNLKTSVGQSLKIIDLGQRNLDNGPDYINSVIKIGSMVYKGDIEFHLHINDWFAHGHHYDQRYSKVILHVLWYSPSRIPDELQHRFPHFVLSQFLNCSPANWLHRLSSLAQPSFAFSPSQELPSLTRSQAENLAWMRFTRKCDELLSLVQEVQWETALYMGLGRALGYLNNSKVFYELIRVLPPAKILSIVPATQRSALLFWVIYLYQSGLLEQISKKLPNQASIYQKQALAELRPYQSYLPVQRQQLCQWNFSRIRPHNNPFYRLAGYAQIFYHHHNQSLFQSVLDIFSARDDLTGLLKNLRPLFQLPFSLALGNALSQLVGQSASSSVTMGEERCLQFILNILLPLMYIWAETNDNSGFQLYIEDLYFNFPAADNVSFRSNKFRKVPSSYLTRAFVQQAFLEYINRQKSK
ncbi:MAG: DUF2851 family protein [Calditrichota bacterium]|jgi:hypothetical protein